MKCYEYLAKFKYKNHFYNIYFDSKNHFYFLKVNNDNSLSYLNYDEFFDIISIFNSIPNVLNIKRDNRKKLRLIPKIIINGVSVILSATTIITACSLYQSHKRLEEFDRNRQSINSDRVQISIADDIEEKEDNKPLELDTFLESDHPSFLFIYDMDYLNKTLDYESVSMENLENVINSNNNISIKFKKILIDFCKKIYKKYPNVDLRTFYENLKTLNIVECTKEQLVNKSLSVSSYGCYIRTENKIYVLEDYDYKPGTWAYQVIFHEFSHCLRTGVWDTSDKKIRVQSEGQNFSNIVTVEALNSLFAVSLFDYEEKDIAYQLQSNYFKIIIDCIDNYSLEDYVNHSASYFAIKLDEFNGDINYASKILNLIQLQYDAFHNNLIEVDAKEFYPIYEYILDLFYQKNWYDDITYPEVVDLTDKLINMLLYDVPKEYNIDTNYFYEYMDKYYQTNKLESDRRKIKK